MFKYQSKQIKETLDGSNGAERCENQSKKTCLDSDNSNLCNYDDEKCKSCYRKQCDEITSQQTCVSTNQPNGRAITLPYVMVDLKYDCYGQSKITNPIERVKCPPCKNGLAQSYFGDCIASGLVTSQESCKILPDNKTQPFVNDSQSNPHVNKNVKSSKCIPNPKAIIKYNCPNKDYFKLQKPIHKSPDYEKIANEGRCIPQSSYLLMHKVPPQRSTNKPIHCGSGLVYDEDGNCVPDVYNRNDKATCMPNDGVITKGDGTNINENENPFTHDPTDKKCIYRDKLGYGYNYVIDTKCPSNYTFSDTNPSQCELINKYNANIVLDKQCYDYDPADKNSLIKVMCPTCKNGLNQTSNGKCTPAYGAVSPTCELTDAHTQQNFIHQPFINNNATKSKCIQNPDVNIEYNCVNGFSKINQLLNAPINSSKDKQGTYKQNIKTGRCVPNDKYVQIEKSLPNDPATQNCGEKTQTGLVYNEKNGLCEPNTTPSSYYTCVYPNSKLTKGKTPFKLGSKNTCIYNPDKVIDVKCPYGYTSDNVNSACTKKPIDPKKVLLSPHPCQWKNSQCKNCELTLTDTEKTNNVYCFKDQNNQPRCNFNDYMPSQYDCENTLGKYCTWSDNKCVRK